MSCTHLNASSGYCAQCDTILGPDAKPIPIVQPGPIVVVETLTPLATQVGGQHYKKCKIQPVEYVHANGIGYFEGTAIKYLTRWKDKGGIEDLRKAIHFIEILIELETKKGD